MTNAETRQHTLAPDRFVLRPSSFFRHSSFCEGWAMQSRWAIGLALLATWGCSNEPFSVVPVSGRVLLDGKPLADAHLTFQPVGTGSLEAGPGSYAKTNERGEFTLELVGKNRSGAVVGKHRVNITAPLGPAFDPAD